MAYANGISVAENPRNKVGGWMIIKRWFWSRGFGPGPSRGMGLAGANGLAIPATRKWKKTGREKEFKTKGFKKRMQSLPKVPE